MSIYPNLQKLNLKPKFIKEKNNNKDKSSNDNINVVLKIKYCNNKSENKE